MRIAFICTGNTCRSPMAQGLFRVLLAQRGRADISCFSCGTDAFAGDGAAEYAIEAVKEYGADISGHRSARASQYALQEADLLVGMTQSHAAYLRRLMPEKAVQLLHGGIADPYGGDLDTYRACAAEIWAGLEELFTKLNGEEAI